MKSYLAYIRSTLRLTMRDRLVLFFNYLFPLVLFFAFGEAFRGGGGAAGAAQLMAMVLILSVLGSGFFGGGMRAVMERENNILRRFKVAPITPGPILVSSLVVGWITWLPSVILFLLIAKWRYGLHLPDHLLGMIVFLSFGILAFRGLGLIIASVVNSMAESQVVVQLLYLPMLLLSGATFPLSILPDWLQVVAQFLPSTHLYLGMQSILMRNESLTQNLASAAALCLTAIVAVFISMKLFRWEKGEKTKASAKLWLIAVLAPFLLIGIWQAYSKDNLRKTKQLARTMARNRIYLIRNARVFVGDGTVLNSASILIQNGVVAEIYRDAAPEARALNASQIEGTGKTVLPGFIDTSVNLALSGGISATGDQSLNSAGVPRALAAYLFSGVTAVRDSGTPPQALLPSKLQTESGEKLGAELLLSGQGQPGGMPSLVRLEAVAQLSAGTATLMGDNALFEQVGPKALLESTKAALSQLKVQPEPDAMERAKAALRQAASAGAPLAIGTQSGAPLLLHGPAIHREMQLWVESGLSPAQVLQAATSNGARLLNLAEQSGFVRKGLQANLTIVTGNPLENIASTANIAGVFFRGENIDRDDLLKDK